MKTRNGIQLFGTLEFERFEVNIVDIAVILLDPAYEFEHFISWTDQPVVLTQEITVVGLKYSTASDTINVYAKRTAVDMIENFGSGSALFQASYYSFEGCSGTGVVTAAVNGVAKVVGVHVASHEDSAISSVREGQHTADSIFADFEGSVMSVVHGHKSYCLVCEVARVPDLIALLNTA